MRPRPLYEASVDLPPAEVRERVHDALRQGRGPCVGHVGRRHLNLHIHAPERHVWSPWISIEVSPRGEGSYLRGYFGPHPSLWGSYVAIYAIQVFVGIAGLMHGWISATLGMPTTGLWVALAMAGTLALSCATNIAGEWAGAPQMALIRGFLAELLGL
ncbi:MAG TPA: hypothetical protein ENK18_08825 [Deltaproteobacteria bacterium]|nr:hypothetical protein [Deltaproteobacteria bacterium]